MFELPKLFWLLDFFKIHITENGAHLQNFHFTNPPKFSYGPQFTKFSCHPFTKIFISLRWFTTPSCISGWTALASATTCPPSPTMATTISRFANRYWLSFFYREQKCPAIDKTGNTCSQVRGADMDALGITW